MDRSDIELLMTAAKAKRDSAINAAEAEYQREIDALKVVRSLIKPPVTRPTFSPQTQSKTESIVDLIPSGGPPPQAASEEQGYGEQMRAVRSVLRMLAENGELEIDVVRVTHCVGELYGALNMDRVAVSKALIRLANNRELTVKIKGVGRRATVYYNRPPTEAERGNAAA